MASYSSFSDNQLEEALKEAGSSLLMPPSSTEDLLILLDKVEHLLSKVEQGPSISVHDALQSSMKALTANELLRHDNVNVKVSVASCMSEVMRIMAPDTPFDDDVVKDFFQLSIMAIEKISYMSDRCYSKAVSVIKTLANFRVCVLMLDLELDALIVQMFQLFLNFIRSSQSDAVISNMEKIMTMIVEESEDPSHELLSLLITSVKKENQNVLPLSWELGQNVLKNCAMKLKSDLPKAVRSMGIAYEDYAEVVALICGAPGRECMEAKVLEPDAICLKEVSPSVDQLPPSVLNKDSTPQIKDDSPENESSLKTLDLCQLNKQQISTDSKSNSLPGNVDTTKAMPPELQPEVVPKKRGRKPNSLRKEEEGYDHSWIIGVSTSLGIPCRRKNPKKKAITLSKSSTFNEAAFPSVPGKETQPRILSAGTVQNKNMSASPLKNHSILDGIHSRMHQVKNKEGLMNQDSGLDLLSVSAGDLLRTQDEKVALQDAAFNLRKDSESTGNSKAKHRRGLGKNLLATKTDAIGSDLERKEELPGRQIDANKRFKGSTTPARHGAEESGVCIDESGFDNSSKPKCKRKCTPHTEEASKMLRANNHGEELVGCKIKVWWPKDTMFYEGVITSFDHARREHRVSYNDGDEEILDLRLERWELVEDGQDTNSGADPSANMFLNAETDSSGPAKNSHKVLSYGGGLSTSASCKKRAQNPRRRSRLAKSKPKLNVTDSSKRTKFRTLTDDKGERSSTEMLPTSDAPQCSSLVVNACYDTIDVQGYKVKANVAPLLGAILAKHGDIAAHCLFKSASLRDSLLEVVCTIVQRLQTNSFEVTISELQSIENGVSDAEAAKLEVSWLRTYLVKIREAEEARHRSSLLKEAKANTILVTRAAKRDLQQKQLELSAAQKRFKDAERCVKILECVTQKINSDILLEAEGEKNLLQNRLDELKNCAGELLCIQG